MSFIINPYQFGGGAFSPADVSGLYQWLDASALSLSDNDAVSSWTDESGNGRHATQGTGANQPTFKTAIVNSQPVVRFDGNDNLLMGDMSALTEAEVFIVIKLSAEPGGQGLWWFNDSGSATSTYWPFSDNNIYESFGTSLRHTVGDPVPPLTDWHVYSVYTATNDFAVSLDGAEIYSSASNSVLFPASCQLGRSSDAVYLQGDIAEFILFSAKLSGGDRTSVQSYLDTKYGL